MKKSMLLLMSLLPIFSFARTLKITKEERRYQEQENEGLDSTLGDEHLTLIGKHFEITEDVTLSKSHVITSISGKRTVLFFDTDGDTNTTEVVAAKYCPCLLAEAKIFDAKIGTTKTSLEWRDALKHKDEYRCSGRGRVDPASRHRLVFDDVRLPPIFSSAPTLKITKEERRYQEQENERSDSKLRRKDLTLIGKQFENIFDIPSFGQASFERRIVLFFDTDGDANTTEAVAAKYCPCLLAEAKIFDVKIGDTKTYLEWRGALKHRDEDRCGVRSSDRHKLVWDYVRQ